jgi:uroporphyrinogen-III synthase
MILPASSMLARSPQRLGKRLSQDRQASVKACLNGAAPHNAGHGNQMPAMTASVALFRARDDAAGSAARLRRLGHSVVCIPAIETAPLGFTPSKTRYAAVVASSAKAFLSGAPSDKTSPLYVVGARTARAAKARGWGLAAPAAPNAARLVEMLERRLAKGANVLYLAGRDRKGALEAGLAGTCVLEVVETYAAESREVWRPAEVRALMTCAAALHYSRRSAALTAQLAHASGVAGHFLAMRHVCLSRDVAEPLRAIGAAQILVAEAPEEKALFAALQRALRGFPSRWASRI